MRHIWLVALLAACSVPATKFTGDDTAGSGSAAALSIDPSGDVTLGTVVLGQSSGKTSVTLTNAGDQESGAVTVAVGDASLGFAVLDDHCSGQSLPGHQSCSFVLQFTPTVAALVQTSLEVSAAPGGDTMKVLSASGLIPGQIDITDARYDFLSVALGAPSKSYTFTVRQLGQTALGMPAVTISGDGYSLLTTDCHQALQPGDTCSVTVAFAPTMVGSRAGTLQVSAMPGGTDSAALDGLGIAHLALAKVGTGTVTSTPSAIDCGAICAADVDTPHVSLAAVADSNASFTGWGGACTGTGTCAIDLAGSTSVTASFSCNTGFGPCGAGGQCSDITGDVANCGACGHVCTGVTNGFATCSGSQCGLACSPGYTLCGMQCVDLTSDPMHCGACGTVCPGTACSASQCLSPGQLALSAGMYSYGNQAVDVPASQWGRQTFTVSNTGSTTIGTPIATLTTNDANGQGASFTIGTNTCNSPLGPTQTCSITVVFAPTSVGSRSGSLNVTSMPGGADAVSLSGVGIAHVSVSRGGNGGGSVASTPAGIDCGMTCAADFTMSPVALAPTAFTGSSFVGWTGDCPPTASTCSLNLTGAKNATALFALNSYPVQVTYTTANGGTSTISGVSCTGNTCSGSFLYNSTVTLTAQPDVYSRFVGWATGPCASSTNPTCTFKMPAGGVTASASFTWYASMTIRANHGQVAPVYIEPEPTSVTTPDYTIDCSDTTMLTGKCSAHFPRGATIQLDYYGANGGWFTCSNTIGVASGDCQPPSGPLGPFDVASCTFTFSAPGDYTSEYDVFCQ